MAISRFLRAPSFVREYFDHSNQKVFTIEDIDRIFQKYVNLWSLSVSTGEDFEKQLVQSNILEARKFEFEGICKSQIRFWTNDADVYDIALSLMPGTHFSHITALYLHGVVEIQPKCVFITSEQSEKQHKTQTSQLKQENINKAFSKKQRQPKTKCVCGENVIIALNGMYTNCIGVTNVLDKPVTSLERTLIDITVRPDYSGGVTEVLKSFVIARNTIDVDLLIAMLDDINYTYPYFQCIGFYLEKAGYSNQQILSLRNRRKHYDFYLGYAIERLAYSKEWKIFYPKDFDDMSFK